jgi:hypothetical protein
MSGDGRRMQGPSPDDFSAEELVEIDERAREAVEAEEDETTTSPGIPSNRKLRKVDPKLLGKPTFAQRVAAVRREAAEDIVAERKAVAPARKPMKSLAEILGKSKPEPEPEPKKPLSWLEKWFGPSKKSRWG